MASGRVGQRPAPVDDLQPSAWLTLGRQPVVADFLAQSQIPARLELAGERGAHGQEVGGGGHVVHAEDVRAALDAVGERGERARQALARRARR